MSAWNETKALGPRALAQEAWGQHKWAARYEAGEGTARIAASAGCSERTVSMYLKAVGVVIRPARRPIRSSRRGTAA